MQTWETHKHPSKITVPERAHPLAKLVFAEMKRQRVSYQEMEFRSGVLRCTFKAWRHSGRPGLETIEATLGSLGWRLVPVPDIASMSDDLRGRLEEVGQAFTDDYTTAAACIAAWLAKPAPNGTKGSPAPNPLRCEGPRA